MCDISVYFVDGDIQLIHKDQVLSENFKSVSKGRVINKELFQEEFNQLFKKAKIKSHLLGDSITIVKNRYYFLSDIFFLEHLFLDIGFVKVFFKDINDLFFNQDLYIEINQTYLVYQDTLFDFQYMDNLKVLLGLLIKDYEGNIILYGKNDKIPKLKLAKKNIYYFDHYQNYIVESLLKANKN